MGGSGGGSSGVIDYPGYMTAVHGAWLDLNGTSIVAHSIVDAMNTAFAGNPYSGVVANDPAADLSDMFSSVDDFNTVLSTNFNPIPTGSDSDFKRAYEEVRANVAEEASTLDTTTHDTTTLDATTLDTTTLDFTIQDTSPLDTQAINNTETTNDINEYSAILQDQLDNTVLPKFQAAMLNIGAVQASSFVVGQAILQAFKDRDVARYGADLRSKIEVQLYELNGRHMLSRRQLDAEHARSFRQITAAHEQSFRRITADQEQSYKRITAANEQSFRQIQAAQDQSFRRISSELARSYRELEARHKIQRGEIVRQMTNMMVTELLAFINEWGNLARLTIESRRMSIVANQEQITEQTEFDSREALWEMQTFAFGGNLLASIAGGVHQNQNLPSKAVSALSGALSGAASGAVIGTAAGQPVIGAVGGAILGVGAALLSR